MAEFHALAVDRRTFLHRAAGRYGDRLVPQTHAEQWTSPYHAGAGEGHRDPGVFRAAWPGRQDEPIHPLAERVLERQGVRLRHLHLGTKRQEIVDEGEGKAVV